MSRIDAESAIILFTVSLAIDLFVQMLLLSIYNALFMNSPPFSRLFITPDKAYAMIMTASYIINLLFFIVVRVSYVNELYESYLSYSRDIMESGLIELLIVTLAWLTSCCIIILHVLA